MKSINDGSLPIKILNRVSRPKYVLSPDAAIERHLGERFPGGEWRRLSPKARQIWVELSELFAKTKIEDIAYVGAHDGEVAVAIDQAFPGRHFYLIEPVRSSFQKLFESVSQRPNMKCLNLAAGPIDGQLDMFVDSFLPASSLLPYENIATREFPFLGRVHTERVHVKPLDLILEEWGVKKIDMLVIDVQGYEDFVLQGAAETLRSCKAVMSELSLQALYAGSSTFDSVYQVLVKEGFTLKHLLNPIVGDSGTILQIDGIFVRG